MSSSRLKSKLWLHFTAVNGEKKVKCLYCGQQLSVANKSTCSLIRHINKKHPTQHIMKQTHRGSNNNNYSTNDIPTVIPSTSTALATAVSIASPVPPPLKKGRQKVDGVFHNKIINAKKQKEINRQLVRMIIKEYHPISIVEDKEFVKLLNLLNPAYKLPTRKTVSNLLIPAVYNETLEKVKNRLKRAFAVCLTTDGWTSRAGESFYAFTAHYIVENNERMVLDSDLLGCISFTEHHTAENIAKKIKDIIAEWQIVNKVVAIVSDNSAKMIAALRLGEWRHWGCFAHSLNLIAQAGIKEIEVVVDKIKTVVSYFKSCSHATSQLKATQENMNLPILKLKDDVPTRWNSTFDMIKRILSIKKAVISTVAVLKSSLLVQNEEVQEVDVLTPAEWLIAEQAVQVLEVFNTLTTVISSQNKVTMSSIIIYLKQLKINLRKFEMNQSNLVPEINSMVARLLRELNLRFFSETDHIEDNDLVGLSTILDPRFKKFGFIDKTRYKKMLEKLYSIVTHIRPMENSENVPNNEIVFDQNMVLCANKADKLDDMLFNDFDSEIETVSNKNTTLCTNKADKLDDVLFNDFDNEIQKYIRPANATASAVVEVDKFLQEPLLPRKDANGVNMDPLLWWFQRKHIYPRLYQVVKTRLNIMATSVPCKRIFTDAGQIINKKRGNLKANKISNMVFLNYNLNDKS